MKRRLFDVLGRGLRSRSLCSFALAFLLLVGAGITPASAQHSRVQGATSNTIADGGTLAFPGDVSSGSLIVVGIGIASSTNSVTGITDTRGNTYARVPGSRSANVANIAVEIWYAANANAGANTLTFDWDTSANYQVTIEEYSDFSTGVSIDQVGSTSDATVTMTCGSPASIHGAGITTTQATSLVFAYARVTSAFAITSVGDSGFAAGTYASRSMGHYKPLTATETLDLDITCNASGGATETAIGSMANFYATPGGNTLPTVALNTADATEFMTTTPTLEFTGSDVDADDLEYDVQIGDNDSFDSGLNTGDSHTAGSTTGIHPNPLPATITVTTGEIQVDDRPGMTFTASGGVLSRIRLNLTRDEADTDGVAYVRIYEIDGTIDDALPAGANELDGGVNTPTAGWIAVSDGEPIDTSLALETPTNYDFDFTGANAIRLNQGAVYMFIMDWVPTTPVYENTIEVNSAGAASGVGKTLWIDGESANYGSQPTLGIIYTVFETQTLSAFDSTTDAGFLNTVAGGDLHPFTAGERIRYTVQSALTEGMTYYWRVRANDGTGDGDWSETRSFSIAESEEPGDPSGGVIRYLLMGVGGQ